MRGYVLVAVGAAWLLLTGVITCVEVALLLVQMSRLVLKGFHDNHPPSQLNDGV